MENRVVLTEFGKFLFFYKLIYYTNAKDDINEHFGTLLFLFEYIKGNETCIETKKEKKDFHFENFFPKWGNIYPFWDWE